MVFYIGVSAADAAGRNKEGDRGMTATAAFSIGDFVFESFHEFRDGQEDLKKIEAINGELDIQDPEVAVRLYRLIRGGDISFKTAIGDDFAEHIADIVAEKSQDFIDDEAAVNEAKEQVRNQKFMGVATVVFAIALFAYFGVTQFAEWNTARKISKLRDSVAESAAVAELNEADGTAGIETDTGAEVHIDTEDSAPAQQAEASSGSSGASTVVEATIGGADTRAAQEQAAEQKVVNPFERKELIDPSTLKILPEYQEAYAQNNDLIGWLKIPDTSVDYPVTQRADDNEYYLDHAFDGSTDSAGSLFMDYRSDAVNPTTNTIIYGHNMKSGLMFGQMSDYLDSDYYNAHKLVSFDTIYEKRSYEIVAVCLSEVAYQDENGYRYYNFIQAGNRAEWDAFVNNIRGLSVYGTNINLAPTDEVLTLSTCNSYTQDGRLFLVAKRIQE